MLGAADDFVLELFGTVHKIIAVTGYSNNQIAIFLRVLLGLAQRLSCDHIELNMMTHQLEVRAN